MITFLEFDPATKRLTATDLVVSRPVAVGLLKTVGTFPNLRGFWRPEEMGALNRAVNEEFRGDHQVHRNLRAPLLHLQMLFHDVADRGHILGWKPLCV